VYLFASEDNDAFIVLTRLKACQGTE